MLLIMKHNQQVLEQWSKDACHSDQNIIEGTFKTENKIHGSWNKYYRAFGLPLLDKRFTTHDCNQY